MRSIRNTALACVVAAVAMLPLHADAQGLVNQDTYFTFSQPVELPGTTLPAGTYFFQLADTKGNRHIVKVMSEDRMQLHTTLLAIPSYSVERPSEEPQVRFMEGPESGPQAVKMWFYPGRTVGHEFIYPRSQATEVAQRTGDSVLTTRSDVDVAENVSEQDITRIDREGRDADARVTGQQIPESDRVQSGRMAEAEADRRDARTAQVQQQTDTEARATAEAQAQRAEAPAPTAQQRQAQAPAVATPQEQGTRSELPRTASMLPLLALLGLGSLVGSRWLRRSRRSRM